MKKHKKLYGIIGLGRFGISLAESLANDEQEILVLDSNEMRVREAAYFTENVFTVREMTKTALKEVGIQNCDVVFVCVGEKIDISILTTLNVLELGVKKVIARAIGPEQCTILEKIGAEVVYPERDMALRLSKIYTSSHIMEYISLSNEVDITELRLSRRMNNKKIDELELRQKYGLNIIAIRQSDGNIITDIQPEMRVDSDDIIVVCGKKSKILAFENYVGEE